LVEHLGETQAAYYSGCLICIIVSPSADREIKNKQK
jgi:hypothetical protein